MNKSSDKIANATALQHHIDGARSGRGAMTLTALALIAGLGACAGSVLEASLVCIKPHGGANYQLAPSAQCEAIMDPSSTATSC